MDPNVRDQYMNLLKSALGEQKFTELLNRNAEWHQQLERGNRASAMSMSQQPPGQGMLNQMPSKLPVQIGGQQAPWAPNAGKLLEGQSPDPSAPRSVIPDLPAPPAKLTPMPEAKPKTNVWEMVGKVGTMLSAGFAPHMYPHLLQHQLVREEAEAARQTASIMVDVGKKTREGDFQGAMDIIGKSVGKSQKLGKKGIDTLLKTYGEVAQQAFDRDVGMKALVAATKAGPSNDARKMAIISTYIAAGADQAKAIAMANALPGPKVQSYDKDRGMLVYEDGSTAQVPGWQPEAPKVTLGKQGMTVTPSPGQPLQLPQLPPGAQVMDFGGSAVITGGGFGEDDAGAKMTPEQTQLASSLGIDVKGKPLVSNYTQMDMLRLSQAQDQRAIQRQVAAEVAKVSAMGGLPFVVAHPTAARIVFDKSTGRRDDGATTNQVVKGTHVALSHASAESVQEMQAFLPSFDAFERAAKELMSKSGGGANLINSLVLNAKSLGGDAQVRTFLGMYQTEGLRLAAILNKGRPTEPDAEAARALFPQPTDTVESALAKLKAIRAIAQNTIDTYLGNEVKGNPYQPAHDFVQKYGRVVAPGVTIKRIE